MQETMIRGRSLLKRRQRRSARCRTHGQKTIRTSCTFLEGDQSMVSLLESRSSNQYMEVSGAGWAIKGKLRDLRAA